VYELNIQPVFEKMLTGCTNNRDLHNKSPPNGVYYAKEPRPPRRRSLRLRFRLIQVR
jgi:hypothetical protein